MSPDKFIHMIKVHPNRAVLYLYMHSRPIKKWIVANSGSPDEAKDILQDGLTILYENLHKPDAVLTTKPQHYFFGICKNLWYTELRRIKPMETWTPEMESAEVMDNQMADLNVLALLNELGDKCKQLLKLFYYEKQDMQSIAKALGFRNDKVAKAMKYKCLTKARNLAITHKKRKEGLYEARG